jgi:CBS domain-containing protein
MKTVNNIIQNNFRTTISVSPNTSVLDALQIMLDKNISALLVMEGNFLRGIFTERDYARKIILVGKSSKATPIKEVMTEKLVTIELGTSIDQCMQIMTERRIRHLPILENGLVIGIVSIGDLVKFVIEDQKQTIEQLQNYISS